MEAQYWLDLYNGLLEQYGNEAIEIKPDRLLKIGDRYYKFERNKKDYILGKEFLDDYGQTGRVPQLLDYDPNIHLLITRALPHQDLKSWTKSNEAAELGPFDQPRKLSFLSDLLNAYEELNPKQDFKDMYGNISNIGIQVLNPGTPDEKFDFVFFEGGSAIGGAKDPVAIRQEFFGSTGIYGGNYVLLKRFIPWKEVAKKLGGRFSFLKQVISGL